MVLLIEEVFSSGKGYLLDGKMKGKIRKGH